MIKIKKSLYKFLDDNLIDTFITYDSNLSDVKTIDNVYSDRDLIGLDTFILLDQYGAYQTDFDLTDWYINFNGNSIKIINWNSITSTIVLESIVTDNILTSDELIIDINSWIYMKMLNSQNKYGTKLCFLGKLERWDLIVKVKNDSDNDKIDLLLQQIDDLITTNSKNIPIYDTDMVTVLGYMNINLDSYDVKELIDDNNNIQSNLVTFIVSHYRKY